MATAIYEYAKNSIGGTILPLANEMVRIMPDSLLYGTGLLSLITYQTPMLFLFMAIALGFIASNYLTSSLTALFPDAIPPAMRSPACTTGLYSPTLSFLSLWKAGSVAATAFPSAPIFIVSTFVFYCLSSLIQQSDVLKELGDEYGAKIPIVGTFSALLLILILIYFMYNSCNSFMTLMFSIGAGGLLGGLLSVLFSSLFGQEAINILGLPLFVRRDKVGKPLYICALKK